VARELIVDIDDEARRLVWSVVGGRMTHHNASLQVFAHGAGRSRVVWIADLLPSDFRAYVAGLIDRGMAVMKKILESAEGVSFRRRGAGRGYRAGHRRRD